MASGGRGGVGGAESKRGAAVVAHSRVCGAADKGPSLDNYLPFARLPSVILGLETEEERGGEEEGSWDGDTSSIARLFRSFASLSPFSLSPRCSRSLPSCEPARRN